MRRHFSSQFKKVRVGLVSSPLLRICCCCVLVTSVLRILSSCITSSPLSQQHCHYQPHILSQGLLKDFLSEILIVLWSIPHASFPLWPCTVLHMSFLSKGCILITDRIIAPLSSLWTISASPYLQSLHPGVCGYLEKCSMPLPTCIFGCLSYGYHYIVLDGHTSLSVYITSFARQMLQSSFWTHHFLLSHY